MVVESMKVFGEIRQLDKVTLFTFGNVVDKQICRLYELCLAGASLSKAIEIMSEISYL